MSLADLLYCVCHNLPAQHKESPTRAGHWSGVRHQSRHLLCSDADAVMPFVGLRLFTRCCCLPTSLSRPSRPRPALSWVTLPLSPNSEVRSDGFQAQRRWSSARGRHRAVRGRGPCASSLFSARHLTPHSEHKPDASREPLLLVYR